MMRNKYLPYILGIICAVMFYLAYMMAQIKGNGASFFSEGIMGDTAILLILLAFVPLLLERIIYTQRNKITGGVKVIHYVKLAIMAAAFVCAVMAVVFMFTDRLTTINIPFLVGRIGCVAFVGGLTCLMIAARTVSDTFVRASGWVTLGGAAICACFMHLVYLVGLVQGIVSNIGDVEMRPVLFYTAFAEFIWLLCLFLVDGVSVYLAVRTVRRLEHDKKPLEYL